MAKPKRKQEDEVLQSGAVGVEEKKQVHGERNEKALAQWSHEIDKLTDQEFEDLDAALYALIDLVLNKCETKEELFEQSKEFLYDLLATDAEIADYLRSVLKVAG